MATTSPHYLQSHYINPASLMELKVLSQVVTQMQQQGNVKGSIPYLAKICQIVDNQQTQDKKKTALDPVRAQAHAQLADAYFKTQQWVQCEASLTLAVKIWEKDRDSNATSLAHAYDQLIPCYETLGKQKMAEYMEQRKAKLMVASSSSSPPPEPSTSS
ncbi:hypothetical protein BDB00DRAFT_879127 [Zychaea mexicana]|uniref:uncharacterized protein n=1 Tax=Zychaea mexicana TaxID=64656 RepID=UPI0022FE9B1E|nr:uncharacterized protein BDB00DRAFT_879127 [Zychaea mexicana]KAI9482530.1 hypothetical protein BDB00DRAFT_879127 [Zychaea mexicana]